MKEYVERCAQICRLLPRKLIRFLVTLRPIFNKDVWGRAPWRASPDVEVEGSRSEAPPVGIETVFNLESLYETGWRPQPPIHQETAWRKLITAPRENGGPRTRTARITRRRRWRRCVRMPRKSMPQKRKTRKPSASKPGSGERAYSPRLLSFRRLSEAKKEESAFLALTLEAASPLFPDFRKSLPCFAEVEAIVS